MDKKDEYIKAKLQEDKKISKQTEEIIKKFKEEIRLENKQKQPERKVIKISLQQAILAFSSFAILIVLGGNLYAHINGKPNLYSAIKNLFIKEAKYTASEVEINQTVESNGVKLTLKTVAMDENILIVKYVAEGEKLANEFYTYNDFEEDEMKLAKMILAIEGKDIGEKGYEKYTSSDVTKLEEEIYTKLKKYNQDDGIRGDLIGSGISAYKQYIMAQLDKEGTDKEKAKERVELVMRRFNAWIEPNQGRILAQSKTDTLDKFEIYSTTEKIEKQGNNYVIYSVYNVDKITNLGNKFVFKTDISQIGNISGKWNFETKLEKARLDTRVETIDFYENNKCTNIAEQTRDDKHYSATVETKKLVISDFSTVLFVQTRISSDGTVQDTYEYRKNGLPCYIEIKDEEGKVLGSTILTEDLWQRGINGDSIFTERVLLNGVNKDTKKLYVDIYEQYKDDSKEEIVHNLVLDIETARNGKKPIQLTQGYVSKEAQVSLKYPGDWTIAEEDETVKLKGPEDIDGDSSTIEIKKVSYKEYEKIRKDMEEFHPDYGHGDIIERGEVKLNNEATGYRCIHFFIDEFEYCKYNANIVSFNEQYYHIVFSATSETQYEKYQETFEKIFDTIEPTKPEESYKEWHYDYYWTNNDKSPCVRTYESGKITIYFPKPYVDSWKNFHEREGVEDFIFENKEYEIQGIDSNKIIRGVRLFDKSHGSLALPGLVITVSSERKFRTKIRTLYFR